MVSEKIAFPIKSLWELMTPPPTRDVAGLDPSGSTGRIYVGDHKT